MRDHGTLQAATKGLGFGKVSDAPWLPFESSGDLPRVAEGDDTRVAQQFQPGGAWPQAAAVHAAVRDARSMLVQLRWGGDKREAPCATALAAPVGG